MSRPLIGPLSAEQSSPAVRWVALAERISVCARMFRDDLSRHAGRWHLSEPEFTMLWTCWEASSSGIGQTELAEKLAISAAQVSGLVEKLRRHGLLEGRRAETDRRRQFWLLTPKGQSTLQAGLADMADWATRLDDLLQPASSRALAGWLDRLAGAWKNMTVAAQQPASSDPLSAAVDPIAVGTPAGRTRHRGAA